MAEPNVLESLPDRAMKEPELEQFADSDAVDWTAPLAVGSNPRAGMVGSWILETGGTAHVLLYEFDGWVSKGSFDAEGLTDEQKRDRGAEMLDA